MIIQQQARDIVHSFYYALPNNGSQEGLNSTTARYREAIDCALISIDITIKALQEHHWQNRHIIEDYEQFKKQIQQL